MSSDKLDWHEPKRLSTMRGRGLDFGMADLVFADPNVKTYDDVAHSAAEQRYIAYGLCFDGVVRVVYTMREYKRRIISMNRVHDKERRKRYD
jgi:uncharacterized DUF497 family protein